MGFSLYIHIPYCRTRCPYCDFNTYAVKEAPERDYLKGLFAELETYHRLGWHRNDRVDTLYVGGGTPSLFSPKGLESLLHEIDRRWPIDPDGERTLEANPGSIDLDRLRAYRQSGWNRLSLGIQSFHDKNLEFLGRSHSAREGVEAISLSRKGGFEDLSIDLIFGLPDQTVEGWLQEIDQAIGFGPTHLSTYNLTLEEKTPFDTWHKRGDFKLPPESVQTEMLMAGRARIKEAGFEAYEISNFAKPGFHSRHNSNYWSGGDYLGIGAGAHSFSRMGNLSPNPTSQGEASKEGPFGSRWWNIGNPQIYLRKAKEGTRPIEGEERLTKEEAIEEFLLTRLRLQEGLSLDDFQIRFGTRAREDLEARIKPLQQKDYLVAPSHTIRLTEKGIPLMNEIILGLIL